MVRHRLPRVPKSKHILTVAATALVACAVGSPLPAHADPGSDQNVRLTAQTSTVPTSAGQTSAGQAASSQARPAKTDQINVTAAQVLALARSQIGVRENSRGGGTKFQEWYAGSQRALETIARDGGHPAGYLNAPWCAMFVSWVGEQIGARPQIGWDAYTVTHAKWFAANDRWGTEARPGAVVFFAWNGSKSIGSIQHVGFVVKDNGNGTISTIEGNTGNGVVEERVRPKSQVVGYGYPEYAT
ncbi:CHAP domain-containing protein [Nonomuraea sp. CA-218870]|uniref:CHAP domain-containing protein n=1 Tax=Nonomuraea sp. CA-218870 TaxID=3239998 RepID=UPI003D8F18AF